MNVTPIAVDTSALRRRTIRPLLALPESTPARRPRATQPDGMETMAPGHPQGDHQQPGPPGHRRPDGSGGGRYPGRSARQESKRRTVEPRATGNSDREMPGYLHPESGVNSAGMVVGAGSGRVSSGLLPVACRFRMTAAVKSRASRGRVSDAVGALDAAGVIAMVERPGGRSGSRCASRRWWVVVVGASWCSVGSWSTRGPRVRAGSGMNVLNALERATDVESGATTPSRD